MPTPPRKPQFVTPKAPTTCSDSLRAVRDTGDNPAWTRFYTRYAKFITEILHRHNVPACDIDDLVQSIMIDLAAKLPDYRYDPSRPFHRYLVGFVKNAFADYCRRQQRRQAMFENQAQVSEARTEAGKKTTAPDNVFEQIAQAEWEVLLHGRAAELLREQVKNDLHIQAFLALVAEERTIPECQQVFGLSRDNLYQIKRRLSPLYARALTDAAAELDSPPALP